MCPEKRESGEGFEPIGNDVSDSWTDETGDADVWAVVLVELFSEEEPVLEGCMPSERGCFW